MSATISPVQSALLADAYSKLISATRQLQITVTKIPPATQAAHELDVALVDLDSARQSIEALLTTTKTAVAAAAAASTPTKPTSPATATTERITR